MGIIFHSLTEDISAPNGISSQDMPSIKVNNKSDQLIHVYRISSSGELIQINSVPPGGEWNLNSSISVAWMVTSDDGAIGFKFFPTESGVIDVYRYYQKFISPTTDTVVNGWSAIWGWGIPDVIKALNLPFNYEKLPENIYSNNSILNLLNAPAAWQANLTGTGVKVAVLDSGIISHPEISVAHAWDVFDGDSNTSTTVTHSKALHGIGVASPIAAKYDKARNDSGTLKDITGVAPDVTLLDIKITSDSSGGSNAVVIADAIRYAVDQGAKVIQISQVSVGKSIDTNISDAVDYAYSNDSLVVWAAGNAGLVGPSAPGSASYLGKSIAVGNFDMATMQPFAGSNTAGDYSLSFLFAPSSGYYPDYDGGYKYWLNGGTSYASPYISGIAALIFQKYPLASVSEVIALLTSSAWQPSIGRDAVIDSAGNKLFSLGEYAPQNLSTAVTNIIVVNDISEKYEFLYPSDIRTISSIDSKIGFPISGIDRVSYEDLNFAFDLNGKAGDALEIILALTGTTYLRDKNVIGQVIHLLDTNKDRNTVVKIAIETVLGKDWSDNNLVQALVTNVLGTTSPAVLLDVWINLKSESDLSPYDLFWSIAESDQASSIIDLVGLSTSGVEYIPYA
jgi:hypothetical protein